MLCYVFDASAVCFFFLLFLFSPLRVAASALLGSLIVRIEFSYWSFSILIGSAFDSTA